MRLDAVTMRQLRALRVLSEAGTLTAAADLLHLSIPAVHSQIRTLEDALGGPLLDRSRKGTPSLTPEGQAVLEAARLVDAALSACAGQLDALRRGQAGRVVLGCVSTGKYFAPRLVADLKALCPGIEVALRIGNRHEIVGALADGSVDTAIMGRPPRAPVVVAQALGAHPHLIIAAPGHPLAGAGRVETARLLRETFIVREEGSGTRILMMRYLDRLGEGAPYDVVPMGSNETIKQAVMAGLGIAFISAHTVTEELRSGRLAALDCDGLPIERTWFLVRRADREPGAALARVIAAITGLEGRFLPR